MSTVKTSAIITKATPYREHDKLLTLFTLNRGKITALCKKSRHTLNRWNSSFEPPLLCQVQLYEKNQYYTITEIDVEEPYLTLNRSYQNMLTVQSMSHIVEHFTMPEMEQSSLFYLLQSILYTLEKKECSGLFAMYYFALQFLKESGFTLQFKTCAKCNAAFTEKWFSFSLQHNLLFCHQCTLRNSIYPRFDWSLLAQLETLYYISFHEMKQNADFLFNYSEIDRIMKELYKGFLSKECLTIHHLNSFL
jgi:DNA repair protein RecO (recombination protein O)